MNISQPLTSIDLFSAIREANEEQIDLYLSTHGPLDVVSSKGYSPLLEVAMSIVNSKNAATQQALLDQMDEDEDDESFEDEGGPNSLSATQYEEKMKSLVSIGVKLISAGLNYDIRAGKTNRSIKLPTMVQSRFPEVHLEWEAAHIKNCINQKISETMNIEDRPSAPPRKL